MKVVYRRKVSDRIFEAKAEADALGKRIECIELTRSELRELKREYSDYWVLGDHIDKLATFAGIELRPVGVYSPDVKAAMDKMYTNSDLWR